MAGIPLSALDVAFLCLESETAPMHMGAVVTFRPRGDVDPRQLTRLLAERAARIPKLRQRVKAALFPPGSANWSEDPDFLAANHIHHHRVSGLYEPDPLSAYASRWIARPLNTRKPLWDLHLVTGLPGGEFALLLKLHHALTDGAGAYAIAAGLLDDVTAAERPKAAAGTSPRSPVDAVKDTWNQAGEAAGIASSVVRAARTPVSPLSAPASAERKLGFARVGMADIRRIRRSHGGTTNDVILAVLAGALRGWMVNRGQRADGRTLRALIPVSVRGRAKEQLGGNKLSGYLCDLPVGTEDPVERLRQVRQEMNRNKAAGPGRGAGAFPLLADRLPSVLHRLGGKATGLAAPLLFDLVVTTVPVPGARLSLDGARLTSVFPFVPLAPRQAVGIAVAVHRDSVHIGLQVNGEAAGDIGSLHDAVLKSAAELYSAAD
ncbi:wax ester/triacylglycerol synthase family O-acyltransferase [Amycolatopsis sp. H20-H5]|uniref:wax ester/triacylglycerol synthase family O-acyltransferase n=1 Tax=Amycolatopsis sp. H20-H5 TaxID=3046309 RepID=UPI002DB9102B|nr:wax ester/triacylglycerol synthase family O-acyltransferase [Amycolatopsis sp. H20-H5]MEC3980023.1 wax ester/triacylglycerol synthase family O-acyltransferase [Amycolatopsis sp. H20-H5]